MRFSKRRHLKEAEKYRDRIGDRLFHPEKVEPDKKHLIQDDIQRVNRILSLSFGKKALDVGCSDGTVTIEIAKRWDCEEVVGIDILHSAIEEAKERMEMLPHLKKKIVFLRAFIEDLDYPTEYFDTISACETLEHLGAGQLEVAMENLVRMLKKEGNMIITVPNRYPAQRYIEEKRDRWNWPTHYHFFTVESLTDFLRKYFKMIDFYPLYEDEKPKESIYLICNCER